jgi:AcrR family transcriptional regulator
VSIAERKNRQLAEREADIVSAARAIADREGWEAVTIRRLAQEIEYSQPVLYSHFENKDAIVGAVAVQGFKELTEALIQAAEAPGVHGNALKNVAVAYLSFASSSPSLYDAMFILPTNLRFGDIDSIAPLRAAFAALKLVVGPLCDNVDAATETVWAALHGLAQLERTGRVKPEGRADRVALLVQAALASRKRSVEQDD